MGNSQGREARPSSSRGHSHRHPASPTTSGPGGPSHDRGSHVVYSSRNNRGSRPDLSFLGIGGTSERDPTMEPRRETKAEREARKLEKERALRAQERERSIREEGVDGGYLVTLGTYTGPEDFSKTVVRQLQIERRLAPFWKGLNDHSDTWTEHQLVAVVNDLPLPAPDEIPPQAPPPAQSLSTEWSPRASSTNINNLTVPITSRSLSQTSDRSSTLSPSHPAFSLPSPTSPIASSPSPFFRGRAKTLAALTTGSRNSSQSEMTPQEVQLQKDAYVNGQRLEAFLYKNASECPICFLYYPPHLNKTRCCDQPICSECFVQIKRPDPHPPEHHEPSNSEPAPAEPQEENQLVSEPAACPFCVQPEFGVTYEPPPFRRGLAYANQSLASAASAMSSSSSLTSQGIVSPGGRRRATSLAANDVTVVTTDRVRPDWAKKLADARSHALRRAAAATALHNAAYMMGNLEGAGSRGFSLGRRRRTMFGSDSAGSSGIGTPRRDGEGSTSSNPAGVSSSRGEAHNDLLPGRNSSRRNNSRIEDLEELMMMEAIRLSLAAEEDRKKKEEKEAAKEAKKEEKKRVKEQKKADKASRRSSFFPSSSSTTNLEAIGEPSSSPGKGKAVDRSGGGVGFNPLSEPTSTLNASSSQEDPQKHLETSRAEIQKMASNNSSSIPLDPEHSSHRQALRNLSTASSSGSSFAESYQASLSRGAQGETSFGHSPNASGVSLNADETPPNGTPGTEPMFNFNSLEAVVTGGNKDDDKAQHIENVKTEVANGQEGEEANAKSSAGETSSPQRTPDIAVQPPKPTDDAALTKTDSQPEAMESSTLTIKPTEPGREDPDEVAPAVQAVENSHTAGLDTKHIGEVSMLDSMAQQHIQ